jgi:hypothetical protein
MKIAADMILDNQEQTQRHLFNYLVKRWGADQVLLGTMKALNILKAAAYKRMNGTTALTSHELIVLSRHFNFSMDTIFQPARYYAFTQPFSQTTSADQFIDRFSKFLSPISALNEKINLTYLASDLPIFHFFSRPYIFSFLFSVWTHEQEVNKSLQIEEQNLLHSPNLKNEILHYFSGYPITEIWNYNMLNNLYQQILFAITVKSFKDTEFISRLLEDIKDLFDLLRSIANEQNNLQDNNRKIYINEFSTYNNIVLLESDTINNTFISYDFPKFIMTWNPEFHAYTKSWIKKIIQRSALISSEGYRQREIFFNKLDKDFKQFEENVKRAIEMYY